MGYFSDLFGRAAPSGETRGRSVLLGDSREQARRAFSEQADAPQHLPPPPAGTAPLPEAPALWEAFATYPFSQVSAETAYAFVLRVLQDLFPTPAYYLYVPGHDAHALVLEYMDLRFDRPGADVPLVPETEAEVLRAPELTMPTRPQHYVPGPLTAWSGRMLNVPLRLDEGLQGVVLCGPCLEAAVTDAVLQPLQAYGRAAAAAVRTIRAFSRLKEEVRVLQSQTAVERRMLGSALEVNRFISLLLDLALTATQSSAGFVAMANPETHALTIRAHRHLPDAFLDTVDLSIDTGLFERSPGGGDVLLLRDYEFVAQHGVSSVLAVPLADEHQLVGVFALLNFEKGGTFADFSLTVLHTFSEQIRLVLSNERLFDAFTERYLNTIKALADAYDVRSPYTAGHSHRVANLAVALGEQMGLPATAAERLDLADLHLAGLIHDVGMCGVAEASEHFQADFNHPTVGAAMVEMLPISRDIVEGVRTHHEWHNGWGFPGGLKGEQVPLSGRILALAEFVVEFAAGHRLRDPLTLAEVQAAVRERRGAQFHPDVVDAFFELPEPIQTRAVTLPRHG